MKAPRRRSAQTLVEVLVAVVVCGAGLAVAASGISQALRAAGHADDLDRAARLLDTLLARLEAGVLKLEDQEGDFDAEGYPDVAWTIIVRPGTLEGISDATLTVLWSRTGQPRELVVTRSIFVDPQAGTQ